MAQKISSSGKSKSFIHQPITPLGCARVKVVKKVELKEVGEMLKYLKRRWG